MPRDRFDSKAGYAENADALAAQYEGITFAETHRDTLHLLPAAPARILDIGAGSGRDAAALCALGHSVVAVEPTAALRQQGQRLHAAAPILWLDDELPDLPKLANRGECSDRIYLTAVWMHLDARERERAMARLRDLVAPGGAGHHVVAAWPHSGGPAHVRCLDP
jgi:protein-L-isoaspartate O-methyltransferase